MTPAPDLPHLHASLPTVFEAVITPHRSLGPAGLRWVAALLCLLSAGVSTGLWLAGAWPVIGFTGLEAALAIWLMGRNARTQACEMLILTERGLQVLRTDRGGRRWEAHLAGPWLQARVQERPGRTPALMLHDRAHQMEVAAALGEAEKRDLAAALQDALHRQRHPVFDNPQLRDPPPESP